MEPRVICAFGDSITYGAFDEECGGWVARLRAYFNEGLKDGEAHEIYNLGVSSYGGETAGDLLARLAAEAAPREPDILLIGIGTNDAQYLEHSKRHKTPLDEFEETLRRIARDCKRLAARGYFLGLPPIDEKRIVSFEESGRREERGILYRSGDIREYDAAVERVARETGCGNIHLRDALKDTDLADGLHPNAQGHRKICERVKDTLEKDNIV